ncbi:hypothetical protein [Caballeronia insecticola]|uniref:Uncharacterized protein n=1 Tax=Caballeronia insecticola TaxID=758793 RepID=R4WV69_9BURK|nr:hypothetical protein [Caballeronia insecticola]BAN22811.1 hypothetical protein BRPE64_ACDS10570 [Caballeronia insecticola]
MYFGTLVTQPRNEPQNWERDRDASRADTPGRWRVFWHSVKRLFGRSATS